MRQEKRGRHFFVGDISAPFAPSSKLLPIYETVPTYPGTLVVVERTLENCKVMRAVTRAVLCLTTTRHFYLNQFSNWNATDRRIAESFTASTGLLLICLSADDVGTREIAKRESDVIHFAANHGVPIAICVQKWPARLPTVLLSEKAHTLVRALFIGEGTASTGACRKLFPNLPRAHIFRGDRTNKHELVRSTLLQACRHF